MQGGATVLIVLLLFVFPLCPFPHSPSFGLPISASSVDGRAVAPDPTHLPHTAINTLTLANGLRALLVENHDAPVVTVEVWYHVGSKDELPGQTGFAHFFEHLMFDGTKNLGPDEFSDYIVRAGGVDNAYTTEDATVFWETVPASDLPVALWLEADRMRNLQITDRVFKNEREVVEEERRERFDNQPYGTVVESLYARAFTVHPYQHMPIGSMEDLNRASVVQVKSFYDAFYLPNNATLIMVGDFESGAGKALVEKYFAPVAPGPAVVRNIPAEPAQTAPRLVKLTEDVSLPAFIEGFHMPADGTRDAYPLRLAAKILSEGSSSRIYRRLVYDKQIALQAESEGNFTEDPNLFFVFAVLNPGHTPAEAEAEVDAILADLRTAPVAPAELDKARNEILRDLVLTRQSDQSRADELGYDAVILKNPELINTEFARFLAVTPGEIERVARRYFVPANMTRVEVYPAVGVQGSRARGQGSRAGD